MRWDPALLCLVGGMHSQFDVLPFVLASHLGCFPKLLCSGPGIAEMAKVCCDQLSDGFLLRPVSCAYANVALSAGGWLGF